MAWNFGLLGASKTPPLLVEYLVVAGGGGGSVQGSGGGGAGGYREFSQQLQLSTNYSVSIGAGGSGSSSNNTNGSNGSNSTFYNLTSSGGGGAAGRNTNPGSSGGSGGGASNGGNKSGGAGNTGGYNPVEGYRGGNGSGDSPPYGGAGGGGAGGVGSNNPPAGGNMSGGIGRQWVNGVYYAGGAGGSVDSGTAGVGGLGGGGNGASGGGTTFAGIANTGGGGGGGFPGASGGSGVVMLRYPSIYNISSTGVTKNTVRSGSYHITRISAGTGNISFSEGSPLAAPRYWRYVEGTAIISHHPRVSRIDLLDSDSNETRLVTYTSDNCSDSGVYQPGTVSIDLGSGNEKWFTSVSTYSVFGGGSRSSNFTVQYSYNNSTWETAFTGVMANYSYPSVTGISCGVFEATLT